MKKNEIYQFINTKGLLLIILLALVIRMICFLSLKPWDSEVVKQSVIIGDAMEYHPLALSLVSTKSFDEFSALRTPGYPIFVALIYSISSNSVWLVLLVQIFLSLISVSLVYKIAVKIFNHQIALLSALIFAIDPTQAYWTIELYTETLFLFLFLLSILYLCKSIKEYNFLSIGLSALFLGLATLVRPISFLFPFVTVIVILFLYNLKIRMKLAYLLLYSLVFLATISPWLIHNYTKYNEAKLSSISGFNLLLYNAAFTEVYKTGKTIQEVRKEFTELAIKQGFDTIDKYSFKSSQIYSNVAKKYIKDNLFLYSKRHLMGIINIYAGLGTEKLTLLFNLKSSTIDLDPYGGPGFMTRIHNFLVNKPTSVIFLALSLGFYLLINYLFSIYGIYHILKNQWKFLVVFLLIILYFSALTGVVGYDRYRIPFMPFINIFCAVGLYYFFLKINDKFKKLRN
jgi:4-amino-4-deoxy-L-arabinose transferase-like glycosyltransferase